MRKKTLEQKLRDLLKGILVPLLGLVIITIGMLGFYMMQYNKLSHNITVGSKFSLDFKDDLDLRMYYYAVISRYQKELPVDKVDAAVELAESLQESTIRAESRKSLTNILDYCGTLKDKMILLSETEEYDKRMEQLDNNIRILTNLIQEEMQRYIYYEAGYLAQIEKNLMRSIQAAVASLGVFSVVAVAFLLKRSFRFTESISQPIRQICDNVKKVGEGEFQITPVQAHDYEVEVLDQGIRKMAGRIQGLIQKEKAEQEEKRLKELQLLQAQVNPHFLYNTLDTIIWLIESRSNDMAITLVSKLSTFFRTSLSKGNDIITMREEISHTESYLEIQKVRYGDIMSFEIQAPEHLMEVKIPKLTIQPLVENALYHGIKNTRKKGLIQVKVEEKGNEIQIHVKDDGRGISRERLEEIRSSLESNGEGERAGFGLATVHERLRLYYGTGYGVQIFTKEGEGTCVEVRMSKNI